jgi:hypothetical protein
MAEGKSRDRVDYLKDLVEYLKHITTLSTGSIVLLATFLEKIFAQPQWKLAVVVSVGGFLVSIIGSVATYSVILFFEMRSEIGSSVETPTAAKIIGMIGFFATWLGFLCGIAALSVFAIRNLSG